MAFFARLVFVLYVVVEVVLFVLTVQWLSGGAVFVWVLATALLGGLLVRREGIRAIETVRVAMRERRPPDRAVPDRGLVTTGGLLLMLPGLLTDLVGLVMVIPVTRPLARRMLAALRTVLVGRVGQATVVLPPTQNTRGSTPGPVIRGEVLDSRNDPPSAATS